MVCGNGVVQGDEECECAEGTKCLFCSNCKLDEGKECTPEGPSTCCDDNGKFRTTAATCTVSEGKDTGAPGYCKAGVCASLDSPCNTDMDITNADDSKRTAKLDQFCGISSENSCKVNQSTICFDIL